jgi:hypothetical protein
VFVVGVAEDVDDVADNGCVARVELPVALFLFGNVGDEIVEFMGFYEVRVVVTEDHRLMD